MKLYIKSPWRVSEEEWNGLLFFRELLRMLDAHLNQPVAETLKLQTLVALYERVTSWLEHQAGKVGVTLEQAL